MEERSYGPVHEMNLNTTVDLIELITNVNYRLENGFDIFTAITTTIEESSLPLDQKDEYQSQLEDFFKFFIFNTAVRLVQEKIDQNFPIFDAISRTLSLLSSQFSIRTKDLDTKLYDHFYGLSTLQKEVNTLDSNLQSLTNKVTSDEIGVDDKDIIIPDIFTLTEGLEGLPSIEERLLYEILIENEFITKDTLQKRKELNKNDLENLFSFSDNKELIEKVLRDTELIPNESFM